MPIDVHCPSCSQKLKVPDSLVGRKVRCQKCNTAFEAVEELDMEIVEEPPVENVEIVEAPPKADRVERTARRSEPKEDDDEDDFRQRRRRRKRRSDPVALLKVPALLLFITGYVGVALNILGIIINLIRLIRGVASAPAGANVNAMPFVMGMGTGVVITALWCGTVIRGAQSMSAVNNYQLALAGCMVACVPCSCSWLLGLPAGIWGLVVLMQKDVKDAFR
jgi:predicted Zn finger-like uncharacterized protein